MRNQLKQIALAMLTYEEEHKRLPPAAITDKYGRPLLSWRVAILPYIEQENLFRLFKLDEPWDSPHNLDLLDKYWPNTYETPMNADTKVDRNHTFFQVIVGPGTGFEPGKVLTSKNDFPDGTALTFLVVEAGRAVPWTKPEDVIYDSKDPLPELGGIFTGNAPFRLFGSRRKKGFNAAMVDGHVRFFDYDLGTPNILPWIVRNDGKVDDQ